MPPAKPASTVSWQGGFFRYREIYPDGLRRWWLGNAGWREPTSSDRLPSIGVSLQPAIPRRVAPQQSPLPLHQSPTIVPQIPVRRGNQNARLNLTAGIQSRSPSSCPSPTGCHLYFARRVTFLSCADSACRSPIETSPASPIVKCCRGFPSPLAGRIELHEISGKSIQWPWPALRSRSAVVKLPLSHAIFAETG